MDDHALRQAIEGHPVAAAEALLAVQTSLGGERPLTAESLAAVAESIETPAAA